MFRQATEHTKLKSYAWLLAFAFGVVVLLALLPPAQDRGPIPSAAPYHVPIATDTPLPGTAPADAPELGSPRGTPLPEPTSQDNWPRKERWPGLAR